MKSIRRFTNNCAFLLSLENEYLEKAYENYILAIKQGSTEGAINLSRLLILDGMNQEDKSNKVQYYYQAHKLLESIRNDVDKLEDNPKDLNLEYNYYSNLGWLHLEQYKLAKSDQERQFNSTRSSIFSAIAELNIAIDVFSHAEELREKSYQESTPDSYPTREALIADFGKHTNAYCLRADLISTLREDGLSSIVDPKLLNNTIWHGCSKLLLEKQDMESYEIEWLDKAKTFLEKE